MTFLEVVFAYLEVVALLEPSELVVVVVAPLEQIFVAAEVDLLAEQL